MVILDQSRIIENRSDSFYINKPFNVIYRAVPNLDDNVEYKKSEDLIKAVKSDDITIKELYEIKDINDLIRFELLKFVSSDTDFKECENCHRYFIPVNRKDEIYCERQIEGTEKTCKQIGALNKRREKAEVIPGDKEYWNIYKRYKYKVERKIITKKEFSKWCYFAAEEKQRCASGEISIEEMVDKIEIFEERKNVGRK